MSSPSRPTNPPRYWLTDGPLPRRKNGKSPLADTLQRDGLLMSCGNGGSMCDAMHFAEEWTGRFRKDRAAVAAVAFSDPSHLTCIANDLGFDQVFAREVQAYGKPGDLLVAISTSGDSPNVVQACKTARPPPPPR